MQVLINATSASLGGGLTVLQRLLAAFVEVDMGRNRYLVIARSDARERLDPCHPQVSFRSSDLGGRSIATRLIWEQLALPVRSLLGGVDVVFSPNPRRAG